MLARLAATLRGRQGGLGGMEGLGASDGDTTVVLDDNCSVSTIFPGCSYVVSADIL
jgi:hypothetical protein